MYGFFVIHVACLLSAAYCHISVNLAMFILFLLFKGECLLSPRKLVIRITFPCNIYPLKPHFYIAKLAYAGVYIFFLLLDCGYSLEPPRRCGSNMYTQSLF